MTGGIYTGKTDWASFMVFHLMRVDPGLYWWVAGLNWQIEPMWDKFALACRRVGGRVKERPYRQVWLPNGAKFEAVTGKNLGLLTAKHPKVLIVDEITKLTHRAIEQIEARCVGAQRVLWMGSADYHPDLIRFMRYGRDHHEQRWALVNVSTPEVGLVDPGELEHLKAELPLRVWNRDILGIVPEGEGAVFTKLDRAVWWTQDEEVKALAPKQGERYRIGFDQAKTTDFSVAAVRKLSSGQIVHESRWQKLDYHVQADLLFAISARYNRAPILADATGALGVMEIFERKRMKLKHRPGFTPITFNNELKQEMVDRVEVALEHEKLKWPHPDYGEVYQTTADEFRVYEMRRTKSGLKWSYGAPEGMHDDCVTAVGLTCMEDDEGEGPIRGLEDDEETQEKPTSRDDVDAEAIFMGG